MVLQAREGGSPQASECLSKLCETYWPPVYAYLRRCGHASADAKDLAQGFFAHLLEKDGLRNLSHGRGKFRSFLLTCLQNFTQNVRERASAQKRGGGLSAVSLEELSEGDSQFEPSKGLTPEEAFEAQWAEALMARAVERLRKMYTDAGKAGLFEQLKDLQLGEHGARGYADIGAQVGLSEAAVKTAVHRMRLRHRDLLRREIARTIGVDEDVEEELRYLAQIFNR